MGSFLSPNRIFALEGRGPDGPGLWCHYANSGVEGGVGTRLQPCSYVFRYGDKDNGFKFSRRGLQERSCTLHEINTEPIFRALRDDPEFRDIGSEFHLPNSPPAPDERAHSDH